MIEPIGNSNEMDKFKGKLLEQLALLVDELKEITEFSSRELKAISILSMNPFMRRFFVSNESNEAIEIIKKEIQKCFEYIRKKERFTNNDAESLMILVRQLDSLMRKKRNLSYVDNKKHLKRKYEKTLLKTITKISESISNSYDDSKFINFFSRDKR